jgi:hypothetical protein
MRKRMRHVLVLMVGRKPAKAPWVITVMILLMADIGSSPDNWSISSKEATMAWVQLPLISILLMGFSIPLRFCSGMGLIPPVFRIASLVNSSPPQWFPSLRPLSCSVTGVGILIGGRGFVAWQSVKRVRPYKP